MSTSLNPASGKSVHRSNALEANDSFDEIQTTPLGMSLEPRAIAQAQPKGTLMPRKLELDKLDETRECEITLKDVSSLVRHEVQGLHPLHQGHRDCQRDDGRAEVGRDNGNEGSGRVETERRGG